MRLFTPPAPGAMDLMCERALSRGAFGKHLSDYANVQGWIAYSRVEID